MNEVEMPPRIAALDRDHRGYPIPFVVFREADGKPDFVINDSAKAFQAAVDHLCAICGQELEPFPWFVGGPGSALLNGDVAVYIDGPMHHECMQFALRVCPHLTHQLTKPVQLKAVTSRLNKQGVITVDNTVIPGVPVVFMALQAWRYDYTQQDGHLIYYVLKPFKKIEYWDHGQMMDKVEGERVAKKHARELQKGMNNGPSKQG